MTEGNACGATHDPYFSLLGLMYVFPRRLWEQEKVASRHLTLNLQQIGEYTFTLLGTLLDKSLKIIPCATHSKLKKEYHYEGIQELLERPLSKKEQKELEVEQKKKIVQTEHEYRQEKEKTLEEHFKSIEGLQTRNSAIMRALEDGYKQAEIARYLNISTSAVSKIFRIINGKSS